jgi:hypothetical protein
MLDWKRSKKSIQGALEIEEAVARCLRARLQYLEAELELAVLCNSTAEAATYRSQIEAACKSLALADQDVLNLRMELEEFERGGAA